jgi:RNA polymerase sigma factor (sigma-70 family)
MPSELHTTELRVLLDRLDAADPTALEELLGRAAGRLERLARGMLRNFPLVRQREQTADVVQEAMLGLIGALRQVRFTSTRDFFGLAAEHIRRRLLDLARYHGRAHRNLEPFPHGLNQAGDVGPAEDDFDDWQALHEAVAALPAEQREVFSLRLYHGWTVEEIAALMQISTRTVSRLWLRAQIRLAEQLRLPSHPGEREPSASPARPSGPPDDPR